jgi:hypothetical protein
VIVKSKAAMSNKFAAITAFCIIGATSCITSSCAGNEQTSIPKNRASTVASQISQSNNSSLAPDLPLIPYGTYIASAAGYTVSLTLNADGTYSTENLFTGKTGGTYTVSPDYITLYEPVTHKPSRQKYTYSDMLKCLYLYTTDMYSHDNDSNSPMPFYKQ